MLLVAVKLLLTGKHDETGSKWEERLLTTCDLWKSNYVIPHFVPLVGYSIRHRPAYK